MGCSEVSALMGLCLGPVLQCSSAPLGDAESPWRASTCLLGYNLPPAAILNRQSPMLQCCRKPAVANGIRLGEMETIGELRKAEGHATSTDVAIKPGACAFDQQSKRGSFLSSLRKRKKDPKDPKHAKMKAWPPGGFNPSINPLTAKNTAVVFGAAARVSTRYSLSTRSLAECKFIY